MVFVFCTLDFDIPSYNYGLDVLIAHWFSGSRTSLNFVSTLVTCSSLLQGASIGHVSRLNTVAELVLMRVYTSFSQVFPNLEVSRSMC